jgi:hypothetical protein
VGLDDEADYADHDWQVTELHLSVRGGTGKGETCIRCRALRYLTDPGYPNRVANRCRRPGGYEANCCYPIRRRSPGSPTRSLRRRYRGPREKWDPALGPGRRCGPHARSALALTGGGVRADPPTARVPLPAPRSPNRRPIASVSVSHALRGSSRETTASTRAHPAPLTPHGWSGPPSHRPQPSSRRASKASGEPVFAQAELDRRLK